MFGVDFVIFFGFGDLFASFLNYEMYVRKEERGKEGEERLRRGNLQI